VLAAAESFAAIRDRSKLGIAIAAMIKMIATTISSSIKEKPFCLRMDDLLLESSNSCEYRMVSYELERTKRFLTTRKLNAFATVHQASMRGNYSND
jgi:hypothetical protein